MINYEELKGKNRNQRYNALKEVKKILFDNGIRIVAIARNANVANQTVSGFFSGHSVNRGVYDVVKNELEAIELVNLKNDY